MAEIFEIFNISIVNILAHVRSFIDSFLSRKLNVGFKALDN